MTLEHERRIVRDRPLSQLHERREHLAMLLRRRSLGDQARRNLIDERTAVDEEIARQRNTARDREPGAV